MSPNGTNRYERVKSKFINDKDEASDLLDCEDIPSNKAGKDIIAANHAASPSDEKLLTVSNDPKLNGLERKREGWM